GAHAFAPIHAGSSPEERTESAKLWNVLQTILQQMTDDQREVYQLHVLEEMSIPDIAAALGVPEGTVRSRLRRAREVLDQALARLRASEKFRATALLPLLVPASLVQAARATGETARTPKIPTRDRFERGLGPSAGVVGPLAAWPSSQVAAGAIS